MCSDLPASTESHIKSRFYTRLFLAPCRSNLHKHGRTGQARARVERSTLSTFISTRFVLDPTTGFVSFGVKKCRLEQLKMNSLRKQTLLTILLALSFTTPQDLWCLKVANCSLSCIYPYIPLTKYLLTSRFTRQAALVLALFVSIYQRYQ